MGNNAIQFDLRIVVISRSDLRDHGTPGAEEQSTTSGVFVRSCIDLSPEEVGADEQDVWELTGTTCSSDAR